MKWTGLNELRELYLSFFESKMHTRLPSYSLVPKNDKSLLLINSGMAPMKKYFLGLEEPPNHRVTTCQKCIRTPDIERVGITARHGTFFEMLGNFSFGDYFKVEATKWAWEFLTEVLEIPADRLWISIYEEDDEAFDIWTKIHGIPAERIVRLGKEDNFWEHGTGPCGPCSEIYFDRGEGVGCGRPECAVGCDCDRFMEIWNLVFSQFDSDGQGNYAEMEMKNIDTGMGLERLACVMQGVNNLFEVDTVQNIMKHIMSISDVTYGAGEKTDISLRVITDHIRSTTFMISDGIIPSNEGRGYVLRRLLRRAARHGKLLGIEGLFLSDVAKTVINENRTAYPELVENEEYIVKVIHAEEESFAKTINSGMEMLMELLENAENKTLSGDDAFKLYDTFGFPIDLTREIAAEKGISIDEEKFTELMNEQKVRARTARKDVSGWDTNEIDLTNIGETEFKGYKENKVEASIQAIVAGGELTETLEEGDSATIILSATSFYGESGGQVGDTGLLIDGDNVFTVTDVKKDNAGHFLHIGTMTKGSMSVGSVVSAEIDTLRRHKIMSNHSACHLLQYALRTVLGSHVHQSGSFYDDHRCRFDFSHFSAMTAEEIAKVEAMVNEMILADLDVVVEELPIAEAKNKGAMALFGEKYGDVVRVVTMGDDCVEFCGGTHVAKTGQLGVFKIIAEASVAAGVRRIEAATGMGVLELLREAEGQLSACAKELKLENKTEVPNKVASVVKELKEKERTIEALNAKIAGGQVEDLFKNTIEVGSMKLIFAKVEAASEELRTLGDQVKSRANDVIAVFAGVDGAKGTVLAVCGTDAVKAGAHAGKLVKEITALLGGKGGGRPDSAMGGISDIAGIDGIKDKVIELVSAQVNK
ncbi:MAG: alanine--tRNA ligase [Oscillospiraceae bacterium]|nr:alanine--tRNA ligase [Oscillospiraceae bacterium]